MHKKKILILFVFLISTATNIKIHSLNYITTAQSIAWNGAYTSVGSGFEAMLYNPAGLYRTKKSYGLIPFFGTLGARLYTSALSSSEIISVFYQPERDITNFARKKINDMHTFNTNLEIGVNASIFNFMTYKKNEKYSFGISILPKTSLRITIDKSLFKFIFEKIDLNNPFSFFVEAKIFNYFDFNYMMSSRVEFLEKRIPIFKEIYAGIAGHFYLPGFYADFKGSGKISKGTPSNLYGVIPYDVGLEGKLTTGGLTQIKFNNLLFGAVNYDFVSGSDVDNLIMDSIIENKNAFGFGLGIDFGALVVLNKTFSFGFSVTDLGFFTFPAASEASLDFKLSLDPYKLALSETTIEDSISFKKETSQTKVVFFPAATAIRTGCLFTPFEHKSFDMKLTCDFSLSDFDKIADNLPPVFNFSTGIEFRPKTTNNVSFPLRTSFNFNTEAFCGSFSFGAGLYIGPIEFDFGIKGLEFFIDGWGAKEIEIGFDMKYEFD